MHLQDTFEARFARVLALENSTSIVNTGTSMLTKDESSDESSSEDDNDAVEREKKLAALQQQVLSDGLLLGPVAPISVNCTVS